MIVIVYLRAYCKFNDNISYNYDKYTLLLNLYSLLANTEVIFEYLFKRFFVSVLGVSELRYWSVGHES